MQFPEGLEDSPFARSQKIEQMLKISAFYLEKQKSFIPKKIYNLGRSL